MMWLVELFKQVTPGLPRCRSGRPSFPLFGKEGPGEICAVNDGFTSPTKSPSIPLWQRGKRSLQLDILDCDTISKGETKRGSITTGACNDILLALVFTLCFFWASPASAHDERPVALRGVDLEQKLGSQVPLDLEFRDVAGRTVKLNDYFGRRPVILNLVYYSCEDLCPLVLEGLVRSLRPLTFNIGDQFDVVTLSFDARDTPALAAAKKSDALKQYGRPGAAEGWHFLTGDEAAIRRLTEAVGFRYNYESDKDRFGHASGIVLLTPEGKVARYFYGIEFAPRDLRLGLIEAADKKIGSPIDRLLLFCYHYDPATGKYSLLITNLIRLGAVTTVLALATFIGLMLRRDRNRGLPPGEMA